MRPRERMRPVKLFVSTVFVSTVFVSTVFVTAPLRIVLAGDARAGVIINEVLYHAPGDLERLEFIELFNSSGEAVRLDGWKFTSGIQYAFGAGAEISAGGYLVLARDRNLLREIHGVEASGEYDGALDDGGEKLTLRDASGSIVEAFEYDDRSPWPVSADGYSASLERITPAAPPERPGSWSPSSLSADYTTRPSGTPGRENKSFSPSLPPVIAGVSFSPQFAQPNEPIRVEATVEEDPPAERIELLYRVVRPGAEGDEVAVPMARVAGGVHTATVPGQEPDCIVRFRVRARGNEGSVRFYPPENEVRPALSAAVLGPIDAGKISVAYFFNAGEEEFRRGREYRETHERGRGRGGFRGFPRLTEEDRKRMDMQARLSPANLARAWADLTLGAGLAPEARNATAALLRDVLASLDDLRREVETTRDLESVAGALSDRLAALRGAFDAAKAFLTDGQVEALAGAIAGGAGGAERGSRRGFGGRGGPPDLGRFLDIEGSWLRVTVLPGVSEADLDRLEEAHRDALAGREALAKELEQGEERDFREVIEEVESRREGLERSIASVLDREQLARLERESPGGRDRFRGPRGGFGRRGGPFAPPQEGTPLPPQGRSALIYLDPQSRQPELFDFIHIVERASGYKVRLHKDRPLAGMTTVNVLYDRDERSTLVELPAYELYRLAGVARPLAGFTRVLIDGHAAGYHLWFEQPNTAFLRRNELDPKGNLYKVIWQGSNRPSRWTPEDKMPQRPDVAGRHEKKTNPHEGYEDLIALVESLESAEGDAAMWELIQERFDVDQVIGYFAANMLLSHWDGFFNNYFLYHDTGGTGKWTLYPWDQDSTWSHRMSGPGGGVFHEMPLSFGAEGDVPPGVDPDAWRERAGRSRGGFGGFRGFGGGGAFWWRAGGEISRPLLANPPFRERFLARLVTLAKTVYTEEVFDPIFERMRDELEEEVKLRARTHGRDPDGALADLEDTLAFLLEHLRKRREFVLEQAGELVERSETAPGAEEKTPGAPQSSERVEGPERVDGAEPPPARDRVARGGFGGPPRGKTLLVERFDAGGDGRLDAAERSAAREHLREERAAGRSRGRGRGPGRGFRGPPGEPPRPGPAMSPEDVPWIEDALLYDPTVLRTLFLEFEGDGWEQELEDFSNTDVEVPAKLTADGKVYPDVGVHFRGASSLFTVGAGRKRSLNLSLDFADKGQRLYGYRTLNLLNSHGDPTFLRTVLYSEIARAYLPAPKANFVRVVINGECWGVYVNAQQFNKDFVKEWFGTTEGARWKAPGSPRGGASFAYLGDDPASYRPLYEIRSRDDPRAWADLIELLKVLDETPPERLEEALAPRLDIDGTLRFLAVENALINNDGYWIRTSDYNLYQDPEGRFHLIPHDMNETFLEAGGPGGPGGFGRRGFGPGGFGGGRGPRDPPGAAPDGPPPDGPPPEGAGERRRGRGIELDPLLARDDANKPLLSKLLAVPALRERYLGYVREVAEEWLDWERLGPMAERYHALIAEAVQADTRKLDSTEAFVAGLGDGAETAGGFGPRRRIGIKQFADARRKFLLEYGARD